MNYRQIIILLVACFSASAQAQGASKTWSFDLSTPGVYHIQVEHNAKALSSDTLVSYTYQIGKIKNTREMDLIANGPFIPIIFEVERADKARVVIAGLPKATLDKTTVYIYNGDAYPPGQKFDPARDNPADADALRTLLKRPAEEIDLATTKLTIDKMIDPSIDINANLKKIDGMVTQVKAMAGLPASDKAKLRMLRQYLFVSGEWNNFQPYQYDLDDPRAGNIRNALLSSYLATKKGNCVTMPLLFVIVAQRLGLHVTASNAPQHVFVKYKMDSAGPWYNMETTNGGSYMPDEEYRAQFPLTDTAVKKGVYL